MYVIFKMCFALFLMCCSLFWCIVKNVMCFASFSMCCALFYICFCIIFMCCALFLMFFALFLICCALFSIKGSEDCNFYFTSEGDVKSFRKRKFSNFYFVEQFSLAWKPMNSDRKSLERSTTFPKILQRNIFLLLNRIMSGSFGWPFCFINV